MEKYGVFEVVGPVMVGPSSSHTAGACRIAGAALNMTEGRTFDQVLFRLHGSFASTYRGHGTDLALVGGVASLGPADEGLLDAFKIAREAGISWSFDQADLGDVHPNTVEVIFYFLDGGRLSVTGSSTGGGNIRIIRINDIQVDFKNEFPTIIMQYEEQAGVIAYVSSLLMTGDYNIESIITRKEGDLVTLIVETTESLERDLVAKIFSKPGFSFSKYIERLKEDEDV